MKKARYSKNNQGFSLVEVMLAIALFSIIGASLISASIFGEETSRITGQRARAISLAEEGLSAVKNLKDSNFASLSSGTYGLSLSGSQWNLVAAPDITDSLFYRTITLTQINATTYDVLSEVVWQQNAQRSGLVSLTERLRDFVHQNQYTETTVADFTAGTIAGLDITNTGGGEMQLSSATSWLTPVVSGNYNTYDNITANDVAVSGNFAYIVTDRNNGNTCGCGDDPEFYVLDVSSPTLPTLVGELNIGADINAVSLSGNYAYVATNNNSSELLIVNISNPASPSLVAGGTYNTPGNSDGLSITSVGTKIYLGIQSSNPNNELFVINAAVPAVPTLFGSYNMGSTGTDVNDVDVLGNYAYVATGDNGAELSILNVLNPASIVLAGSYNATGNGDGLGVDISGTTAYLVRTNAGSSPDFHIVNVTSPASPSLISELDLSANNMDIASSGSYVFVGTGSPDELITVDVATPASPVVISQFNTGGQGEGVRVFGQCVLVVGSNNSAELQRICASGGAGSYLTSGTFTSQTINSAQPTTAWKKVTWSQSITNPDTVEVQLRTAPDNSGSPGAWTSFQGPTGTGDYYTSTTGAVAINPAHSDGANDQWIQYRVTFSGSGATTPIFTDITFTYQ